MTRWERRAASGPDTIASARDHRFPIVPDHAHSYSHLRPGNRRYPGKGRSVSSVCSSSCSGKINKASFVPLMLHSGNSEAGEWVTVGILTRLPPAKGSVRVRVGGETVFT